jgi:hypothetical protein
MTASVVLESLLSIGIWNLVTPHTLL